jgi:hypothetical protein
LSEKLADEHKYVREVFWKIPEVNNTRLLEGRKWIEKWVKESAEHDFANKILTSIFQNVLHRFELVGVPAYLNKELYEEMFSLSHDACLLEKRLLEAKSNSAVRSLVKDEVLKFVTKLLIRESGDHLAKHENDYASVFDQTSELEAEDSTFKEKMDRLRFAYDSLSLRPAQNAHFAEEKKSLLCAQKKLVDAQIKDLSPIVSYAMAMYAQSDDLLVFDLELEANNQIKAYQDMLNKVESLPPEAVDDQMFISTFCNPCLHEYLYKMVDIHRVLQSRDGTAALRKQIEGNVGNLAAAVKESLQRCEVPNVRDSLWETYSHIHYCKSLILP